MMFYLKMMAFGMPGPMEWGIILLIALLIFGGRLPKIARGLGSSLVEFKEGLKQAVDTKTEIEKDIKEVTGINDIKKMMN